MENHSIDGLLECAYLCGAPYSPRWIYLPAEHHQQSNEIETSRQIFRRGVPFLKKVYYLQHTACSIQLAAYSIQHTAYSLQLAACSIQLAAYSLQLIVAFSCILPIASGKSLAVFPSSYGYRSYELA